MSSPKAPSPGRMAKAQVSANRAAIEDSARFNQINEVGPYGSVTFSGDIGSPNRTRTVSLDPAQQRQMDARNQLAMSMYDYGSNLGPMDTDFSADAGRVEQATYDRMMGLMNPDIERDQRRLDTKLANLGLPMGGEAYNDEQTRYQTGVNEARTRAALDAVGAGRQEQSRMFDITSRARSQPINELAAILSGNQVGMPNPQAMAQYQLSAPDIAGMMQNNFNQKQGQYNSMLGGLSGLGAAAMLAPVGTFCWVAEELYGKHSIKTLAARVYVYRHLNDKSPLGYFCRLYSKHGKKWAGWVRNSKLARVAAHVIWGRLYRGAYAG